MVNFAIVVVIFIGVFLAIGLVALAAIRFGWIPGPKMPWEYLDETKNEADYMCPNCVTPWKCNGPHIPK
jgi:hypothetical protein